MCVFLKLTKFPLFFVSLLKSNKNLIKGKLSGTIELVNCSFRGMQLIWALPMFTLFYCLLYKYMPFSPFQNGKCFINSTHVLLCLCWAHVRCAASVSSWIVCAAGWEGRGVKALQTDDQQRRGLGFRKGLVEEDMESSFYEDCGVKT